MATGPCVYEQKYEGKRKMQKVKVHYRRVGYATMLARRHQERGAESD